MAVAEFEDLEAALDLALKVDLAALPSAERIEATETVFRLGATEAAMRPVVHRQRRPVVVDGAVWE